jgi:hypothetical protein
LLEVEGECLWQATGCSYLKLQVIDIAMTMNGLSV